MSQPGSGVPSAPTLTGECRGCLTGSLSPQALHEMPTRTIRGTTKGFDQITGRDRNSCMNQEDPLKRERPKKAPPIVQDRWITSREVATRLSVHLNTVARIIKRGELGKVLVLSSKDFRISESALEKFIKSRLVG